MIRRIFTRSNIGFFILFCCGIVVYPHPREIPDSIFILVSVVALLTVCQM